MSARPRTTALLLLGGAFALYFATFAPAFAAPDERARLALAEAVASQGLSAIPGSGSFCRYPPLTSLVAAPVVSVVQAFGKPDERGKNGRLGAAVAQVAVTAATVPAFFALLLALGYALPRSALASVLFAFANPLWPYSKRFYSEPLSGLLVLLAAIALVRALRGSRRAELGIVLAMTGLMLNVPAAAATVGLALGTVLVMTRDWQRLLRVGVGLGLGVFVVIASQWIRFGRLATGYEGESFTFHWAEGLHGLILSPGRSIFLYAPFVALSVLAAPFVLRGKNRLAALFIFAALAGQVVLMSAWWSWHGGDCYGPRLILPVLPLGGAFCVHLLGNKISRWLFVPATALGFYAQLLGFSLIHEYDSYLWNEGEREAVERFDWPHAQLARLPRDVWLADVPELPFTLLEETAREADVIYGDGEPIRSVDVTQRGQSVVYGLQISEIRIIQGGRVARAKDLGARIAPLNAMVSADGTTNALDGDPRTFWVLARFKREGAAFRLAFDKPVLADRIELVHGASRGEFLSRVTAHATKDGQTRRELVVRQGSPRLHWSPVFYAALLLVVVAFATAIRHARFAPAPARDKARRAPAAAPAIV